MILNKKQLLTELALKTAKVALGKGEVIVSEIGATDYMDLCLLCAIDPVAAESDPSQVKVDTKKFNAALIAYAVVDGNGARIFDDEDVPMLMKSSQEPFRKIIESAIRLNGLSGTEGNGSEATKGASSTGA